MQQGQLALPDLRMVPGTFFKKSDGTVWRLEARDGSRWTICKVENGCIAVDEPISVRTNFSCTILSEDLMHKDTLEFLYEHGFKTEEGSRDSTTWENDFSGAWGVNPGRVTTQERFQKKLLITPDSIRELLRMWGQAFVNKFFIGLETLGGAYDAKWDEYDNPEQADYVGLPLSQRSPRDADERKEPDRVRGSEPDPEKYRDASRTKIALPLLRVLESSTALTEIAAAAKNETIRRAAKNVLNERQGRGSRRSVKRSRNTWKRA
jgi:hypothetical protein